MREGGRWVGNESGEGEGGGEWLGKGRKEGGKGVGDERGSV